MRPARPSAIVLLGALAFVLPAGAADPAPEDLPLLATATLAPVQLHPAEALILTADFTHAGPEAFTVESASTSCRCSRFLGAPTAIPAQGAAQTRVLLHAGDAGVDNSVSLWLVGSTGGRKGYLERIQPYDVRDYLTWPEAGQVWNVGDVATDALPFVRTWRLARGNHPQAWDRAEIVQETGQERIALTLAPAGDAHQLSLTIPAQGRRVLGPATARARWRFFQGANELAYHPQRTLRVRLAGDRAATPPALFFAGVEGDGALSRECVIGAEGGGALPAIAAITSSDAGRIRVESALLADGRCQLTVTCAGTAGARLDGHIDVAFSDEVIVRIPYVAGFAAPKP